MKDWVKSVGMIRSGEVDHVREGKGKVAKRAGWEKGEHGLIESTPY